MTNREQYCIAFATVFEIELDDLSPDFSISSHGEWTSLAHISLVSEIENSFDIMLDTEDILALNSFESGMEILGRYGIVFE